MNKIYIANLIGREIVLDEINKNQFIYFYL